MKSADIYYLVLFITLGALIILLVLYNIANVSHFNLLYNSNTLTPTVNFSAAPSASIDSIVLLITNAYWNQTLMFNGSNFITQEISTPPPIATKKAPKTILFWTKFFGDQFWISVVQDYCPQLACSLTHDRAVLSKADAIVFHSRDLNWGDIPSTRREFQRYVYFNLESAAHTYENLNHVRDFWNWTMTPLRNSDFERPYGYAVRDMPATLVSWNKSDIFDSKTKPIAWMVSNCHTQSGRTALVKRIQSRLPVDIYGQCGSLKCGKDKWSECQAMVAKNYYFYLSFENSVCKDYITEKYWTIVAHNVVPIVLKRSIYVPSAIPGSFIAMDDFKNMDEFVNYLQYLMSNQTAYLEYLEWKFLGYSLYYPPAQSKNRYNDMCELCHALWNETLPRRCYSDLNTWYKGADGMNCQSRFADRLVP